MSNRELMTIFQDQRNTMKTQEKKIQQLEKQVTILQRANTDLSAQMIKYENQLLDNDIKPDPSNITSDYVPEASPYQVNLF